MLPRGKRLVLLACSKDISIEHSSGNVKVAAPRDDEIGSKVQISSERDEMPKQNLSRSSERKSSSSDSDDTNYSEDQTPVISTKPDEVLTKPSSFLQDTNNCVLPVSNSPSTFTYNGVVNKPAERNNDSPTRDFSGTDSGDEFKLSSSSSSSSSSRSSSSSCSSSSDDNSSDNEAIGNETNQPPEPELTPQKRGRKRTRNPNNWTKNIAKRLKNSGQVYRSTKTGKTVEARKMGPSCTDKSVGCLAQQSSLRKKDKKYLTLTGN